MTVSTIITLIISICGFGITICTLSRKMITKDDIRDINKSLAELSARNVETEKKIAVLEYKVEELRRKVGM